MRLAAQYVTLCLLVLGVAALVAWPIALILLSPMP